jgi:hypothetical protein
MYNFVREIYRFIIDLFVIIFGGKNIRHFVFKVPYYCRHHCEHVFICRNASKNWKTRKGCLLLNNEVFYDDEEYYFQKGKEKECEMIRRKYK